MGVLPEAPKDFKDIALLAFPAPKDDENFDRSTFAFSSKSKIKQLSNVADGDENTAIYWDNNTKEIVIDMKAESALTTRSLTLYPTSEPFVVNCELLAKNENGEFEKVDAFIVNHGIVSWATYAKPKAPYCMSFQEVTSDHFRLKFTTINGDKVGLSEINLSGAARLEYYMDKQLLRPMATNPQWNNFIWGDQEHTIIDPKIRSTA